MSLKDISLPSETISFSGGSFAVRGLSLPDIVMLVDMHREQLNDLFERFKGEPKEVGEMEEVAMDLVTKAPVLVGHAISLAAGEPEQFETVMKLPLDVQVSALEKVALLTFALEGGAKNFVKTVLRIVQGANGLRKR